MDKLAKASTGSARTGGKPQRHGYNVDPGSSIATRSRSVAALMSVLARKAAHRRHIDDAGFPQLLSAHACLIIVSLELTVQAGGVLNARHRRQIQFSGPDA